MPGRVGIGSLNETSLHEALKRLYAGPDGLVEAVVDGCVVDVRRGGSVVEIQPGASPAYGPSSASSWRSTASCSFTRSQ